MTFAKSSQAAARLSRPALIVAVAGAIAATGCANMDQTQQGTAKGAALGAIAGALIGNATGGDNTVRGAAIGAAAGAIAGNLWSKRMQEQQAAMEQATAGTPVEVTRTDDNQLKLNIPSDISFDRNSATLKPELRSVLDTFAQGLTRNGSGMVVRIVGHTDSTGTDAINNPLSLQRAESVKNYLNDRGVPASRIETVGRGSREPIASNATSAGQAKNRRVEIFLRDPAQQ
ncbi:MAG: OmpA family protein [Aquabacterium sp.]|jgi:outer membrane protein OmpA-like peptidoglycan-associated protein|uniref:OmpA family protein n=1 Tax=Aquabacterium sp. TaxID=1872578 RepID=UPI002A36CC4D|nr:OmpA family protein [Aquabacterium sp.]MDX9844895.1 OmpA family protein [Aquabacterium sp.]